MGQPERRVGKPVMIEAGLHGVLKAMAAREGIPLQVLVEAKLKTIPEVAEQMEGVGK